MSDINTASCIELICESIKDVADFDKDNTNKSNWKRVSKSGNSRDGFVRIFKNKVSGLTVEVQSSDTGSITMAFLKDKPETTVDPEPELTPVEKPAVNGALLMVPPNKYMFHISYDPNPGPPCITIMKEKFTVSINTNRYWKEEHCLNDNDQYFDTPLVYDVLEELKLDNTMEATWITDAYDSLEDLKSVLISRGFYVNQDFWEFMEE